MSASPVKNSNNQRNSRSRGKSCPAGVRFRFNDFNKNGVETGQQQRARNRTTGLSKVANDNRRASFPLAELHYEDGKCCVAYNGRRVELALLRHLGNYSVSQAGGAHNLFRSKLEETHIDICHSPTTDSAHQHKNSNKPDVEIAGSFCVGLSPRSSPFINHILEGNRVEAIDNSGIPAKAELDTQSIVCVSKAPSHYLNTSEDGREREMSSPHENDQSYNIGPAKQSFDNGPLGLNIVKVSDRNDNLVVASHDEGKNNNKQDTDHGDMDGVYETGLFIARNESYEDVEATTQELAMSKKKQESELSDLIHLNEEMQSMWSEKEAEVREMLERFSAYRMAVEADSKEKEELFTEEIIKRENNIKELEFAKSSLQQQLLTRDVAATKLIKDVQHLEKTRLKQMSDIDELVAELAEHCPTTQEHSELKGKCDTISMRVQSVLEDLKDSKVTKNSSTKEHFECLSDDDNCKVNGSHTEYRLLFAQNERDNKRNSVGLMENEQSIVNGQLDVLENGKQPEGYSDHEFQTATSSTYERNTGFEDEEVYTVSHETLSDDFPVEAAEEDLASLVKRLEENGVDINELHERDGAHVPRGILVKLLAEQWNRCEGMCKEKDDEIQHLVKKHKQDLKNLQDLLEEQERSEVKNHEHLAELQVEVDNLRRRNKFLESEVEIVKEEGEDEVCVLRESFQKDLSDQLKRQSVTFLSCEEASKHQLVEMEEKNEELERANEELRQQIAEHCSEIKSWVSGILVLSEEEYNEEFHTISDVLAKLQKMIVENKNLIEQLQNQIREENIEEDYPEGVLSHSWAGHTWNSDTSQKELCSHCKQKKWRRAIMGSFDNMLDAEAMEDNQDEIDTFLEKLDMSEGKFRKRQSLRDSLELAEAQNELRARLGEDQWNTLGTLGEDSLEALRSLSESGEAIRSKEESDSAEDFSQSSEEDTENDHEDFPLLILEEEEGRNSDELLDRSEDISAEVRNEENDKEVAVGINGSIVDDLVDGMDDKLNYSSEEEVEDHIEQLASQSKKGTREKQHKEKRKTFSTGSDKTDAMNSTKKGPVAPVESQAVVNGDDDDGGDMVRVVNLYRSLIDYSSDTPAKEIPDSSDVDLNDNFLARSYVANNGDDGDSSGDDDGAGDVNVNDCDDNNGDDNGGDYDDRGGDDNHGGGGDNRSSIDGDDVSNHNSNTVGGDNNGNGDHIISIVDIVVHDVDDDYGDHSSSAVVVSDNDGTDEDGDEDDCHKFSAVQQKCIDDDGNDASMQTPQVNSHITLKKDCKDISSKKNKNEMSYEISETKPKTERAQSSNDQDDMYDTPVMATDSENDFDIKESETTGDDNLSVHDQCVKDESATSISSEKSFGEFVEKIRENSTCAGFCKFCSDVLLKSAANYEKTIEKLVELKSERERDEESRLLRELDKSKLEVTRYQQQYEDLEKVCEDYQKRIHDHSESMRSRNKELRKLQLSSNILKTEVEWLRQALEITKDYYSVDVNSAW